MGREEEVKAIQFITIDLFTIDCLLIKEVIFVFIYSSYLARVQSVFVIQAQLIYPLVF